MTDQITIEGLEAACRELVSVRKTNLGLEIQLPVIYPSGDLVTVVVAPFEGGFMVHDGGFAAMLLANHGVNLTSNSRAKIDVLSRHYGCLFLHDRMQKSASYDQLPLAVSVVANASRTIGDQILAEGRRQPLFSFRQEVIEKVKEFMGAQRVRENEEVIGKSGSSYRVGATILDKRQAEPVAFVEAVKDREGVDKRFREFFDISQVEEDQPELIVLYDDKASLQPGDLLVLQNVSNVVRFSDVKARLEQFNE